MTRQENVFNLILPAFVSARFFCCRVVACSEEEEASEGLGCELRCRDGRKIFKLLAATSRFMMVKYGKGNRSRCTRFSVMNNWELFVSVEINLRKLERSQPLTSNPNCSLSKPNKLERNFSFCHGKLIKKISDFAKLFLHYSGWKLRLR